MNDIITKSYTFIENCTGGCYNGSRSHLYYIVETQAKWSRTCQTPGFVPVAITTTDIHTDIHEDINEIPGVNNPHWVAGTNMRWVWIRGVFMV